MSEQQASRTDPLVSILIVTCNRRDDLARSIEWEDVLDHKTLDILQEPCGELLAELGYNA